MADASEMVGQILGDQAVIALSAGISIAAGVLATAVVQSSVGSSAMGVIAERPEQSDKLVIYFAIPESLALLGFIIAFFLVNKLQGH